MFESVRVKLMRHPVKGPVALCTDVPEWSDGERCKAFFLNSPRETVEIAPTTALCDPLQEFAPQAQQLLRKMRQAGFMPRVLK